MFFNRKYVGIVAKADGTAIDDMIILRAKDPAVPAALNAYYMACRELGAGQKHLESISELIDRVLAYQRTFITKVPDTNEEDLIIHALETKEATNARSSGND